MLIFINKEKKTKFAVSNISNEVIHVTPRDFSTLEKFSKVFGNLEYLELPNYKAVTKFRKLIEKEKLLQGVPITETKSFLKNNYPELFI